MYCTIPYGTILFGTILYGTIHIWHLSAHFPLWLLYCNGRYCNATYCPKLYFTELKWSVVYCFAEQHCGVKSFIQNSLYVCSQSRYKKKFNMYTQECKNTSPSPLGKDKKKRGLKKIYNCICLDIIFLLIPLCPTLLQCSVSSNSPSCPGLATDQGRE